LKSGVNATLREKRKIIVKLVPAGWLNGIRLSPHVFNTERDTADVISALPKELT
jgi:selenocysteine lyase/cysteine desulfurase